MRVLQWQPRETKRSRGRSQRRWLDDVRQIAGYDRFRKAQDIWRILGDAYVQELLQFRTILI